MFIAATALALLAHLAAAAPLNATVTATSLTAGDSSISATATGSPIGNPSVLSQIARNGKCATVMGNPNLGVAVVMANCVSQSDIKSSNQMWTVVSNGPVRFRNTNLCLDAGENPSNGVAMKLWQCYEGLGQQTWTYNSANGQIKTINNQCLNVDSGNASKLQTWACSDNGDPQEKFTILKGSWETSTNSVIETPASLRASVTATSVSPDVTATVTATSA